MHRHFTVYNDSLQCTVFTGAQWKCTIRRTLYSAYCTLYIVQCIVYNARQYENCTLHSEFFTSRPMWIYTSSQIHNQMRNSSHIDQLIYIPMVWCTRVCLVGSPTQHYASLRNICIRLIPVPISLSTRLSLYSLYPIIVNCTRKHRDICLSHIGYVLYAYHLINTPVYTRLW